MSKKNKILYMSDVQYSKEYVKHMNLFDTMIIIVSKFITASIKHNHRSNICVYESIYDNVEFVTSLCPGFVEESMIGRGDTYCNTMNTFFNKSEAFDDICCMVSLVVNHDVDVIIITTDTEYNTEDYFSELKKFLDKNFHISIYSYTEYVENGYEADIGDLEDIKRVLEFNMKSFVESKGGHIDSMEDYFNWMADDVCEKYRSMISKKSDEELKAMVKKYKRSLVRSSRDNMIDFLVDKFTEKSDTTGNVTKMSSLLYSVDYDRGTINCIPDDIPF